ncbi:MAG: hypothetical protein ACK4K9_01145 [Bacteroidia bacterium]
MFKISNSAKIWLLAVGLLIPLIRFNSNTYLIKQQSYDQKYFAAYVEYLRGIKPKEPIKPATNWRILLPAIASILPFDPKTSLNIVNYIAFILSLLITGKTVEFLTENKQLKINVMLIMQYSFPAFYYTCIGYADTLCLMFISLGVYATVSNKLLLYFLALFFGFLSKESAVLLIPFASVYQYFHSKKSAFLVAILSPILVILLRFILVKYAPVTHGYSNKLFWQISYQSFWVNFFRFNTWFASIATMLPVFVIFFIYRKKIPIRIYYSIIFTSICSILLWAYSFITTIADGRLLWQLYPVMLLSLATHSKLKTPNI